MRPHAACLLLAVALPLAGCSLSASSWSLSKSSRSSSRSSDSSSSSSPGASERAYRQDVADYTYAFARSHGEDFEGFRADVGKLAEHHGITNWEESPDTYRAIGGGLGRAEVSEAVLLAYERNFWASDPEKAKLVREGYQSER